MYSEYIYPNINIEKCNKSQIDIWFLFKYKIMFIWPNWLFHKHWLLCLFTLLNFQYNFISVNSSFFFVMNTFKITL
jgi:hypothetical protein